MKSPLTRRARALRQDMTPHEVRLWACLRAWRSEGIKFRRQVTLGRYIVDFACFRPKLVVELDGGQHTTDDHAARDARRDAWLRSEGFVVFRAWNHEVDDDIDAVLDAIRALVDEARDVLPRTREGGPKGRKGRDASAFRHQPPLTHSVWPLPVQPPRPSRARTTRAGTQTGP